MTERLQPYTPSRIVAAQAMGLLYPKIGNDGLAQLKKTGLYPGELKDIIIVLWLCRLKTKEQVADARLDPIAAYEDAEKWAGKIGLCDMTSDAFGYGLLVFQNIMNEIGESKTTPVTNGPLEARRSSDEGRTRPKRLGLLSPWVVYLAKVAEISRHDSELHLARDGLRAGPAILHCLVPGPRRRDRATGHGPAFTQGGDLSHGLTRMKHGS
jgi:hypothetical protein